MKKVFSFVFSLILLLILFGCKSPSIEEELSRIEKSIPSSISHDITLPLSDKYNVSYKLDDIDIQGNTLSYQASKGDSSYLLTIYVSDGTIGVIGVKEIIMLYNEEEYNKKISNELDQSISEYLLLFPAQIKSSFTLPSYENEGLTIENSITTSMTLKNGVYEYNCPDNREAFIVNSTFTKEGVSKSTTISIPVLSGEEANSVPRVYLSVSSQITKDEYTTGTFTLKEKNSSNLFVQTIEPKAIKIKGRGNSTWGFDKKPFKIKFDEKISLFGEKKAKTWTLIANYIDHSLMRNYAAYYLGRQLDGLEHTTCSHYVDVYLNDEYLGNYLLCEQTEVDKNRLNITDDETKVDTGYLLEMDQKYFDSNTGVEGKDYFYVSMHSKSWLFALHTPDSEDSELITSQVTYIKSYLEDAIAALKGNTDLMYDYFDINSVVDSFIINEITKNKDQGWSSFYIYKDVGSKICFGPIWDYDLSSLGQGNISSSDRSSQGWYTETSYSNPFYEYFLRNSKFKSALKTRWNQIKNNILNEFIDELKKTKDYIHYSAKCNFAKWDVIGKETGWWISDEEHNIKTWTGQVDLLINYYKERIDWISSAVQSW